MFLLWSLLCKWSSCRFSRLQIQSASECNQAVSIFWVHSQPRWWPTQTHQVLARDWGSVPAQLAPPTTVQGANLSSGPHPPCWQHYWAPEGWCCTRRFLHGAGALQEVGPRARAGTLSITCTYTQLTAWSGTNHANMMDTVPTVAAGSRATAPVHGEIIPLSGDLLAHLPLKPLLLMQEHCQGMIWCVTYTLCAPPESSFHNINYCFVLQKRHCCRTSAAPKVEHEGGRWWQW